MFVYFWLKFIIYFVFCPLHVPPFPFMESIYIHSHALSSQHIVYISMSIYFHRLFHEVIMDVQVIILNSMLLFICSSSEVKMEWSGVGTWRVGGLLDRVTDMLWMLLFFQRNLQRDKTGHFFCLFWNFVIAILMFFCAIMHSLLVPWHNSWTDWF